MQVSLKGFGTLAGTGTDTDIIGFRRDFSADNGAKSTWDVVTNSRLGLQLDVQFNSALSTVLQWTAKERVGNFFEQNLDMAFVRWEASPSLSFRIGRMSSDIFMISDYRNIGYAYPWASPPHEFYSSLPFYHYDGVDLVKKLELSNGYLTAKFLAGYIHNEFRSKINYGGVFDQDEIAIGASLKYVKGNWTTKVAYSFLNITSNTPVNEGVEELHRQTDLVNVIWPGMAQIEPHLRYQGQSVHYLEMGAAYDNGIWQTQAEAAYIASETRYFPSRASGYLSLGRRFNSITLYGLLGITKSFQNEVPVPGPLLKLPVLKKLQNAIDSTINRDGVNEKSVSLGLRWDFRENMALKAQWSHYWLGENGIENWTHVPFRPHPDNVNVYTVGIDFIF